KLKHNDALQVPIAFEHFGFAAADNIFPAIFLHRRACEAFVFFIPDWIENVDFNDDVSRHWRGQTLKCKISVAVVAAVLCSEFWDFLSAPQSQPVVPGFAQAVARGLV